MGTGSGNRRKQVVIGVSYPFVGPSNIWRDPKAAHPLDFAAYSQLARTAEAACFDFLFLAESLRPREHRGRIVDLESVGRPDTATILAALAGVTDRLGLAGTLNTTFREPYELARQLATLDHISHGRAAWNVVTTSDAFTGANFRRGAFLDARDRYTRAEEFLRLARELWDSWRDGDLTADPESEQFVSSASAGTFSHHGEHFDIAGRFDVPRSPQGHPVVLQAGGSEEGREFAAASADCVFTLFSPLPAGQELYSDVKRRLARYGRSPESLKILPAAQFALGDTPQEARDNALEIRRKQVSGPFAISRLEQVWRRDLSAYDPDGPLPEIDPDVDAGPAVEGLTRDFGESLSTARRWRETARERGLSIRELVIEATTQYALVGTPQQVADQIDDYVQQHGADGFVISPPITPHGLDEFVAKVVPLLQERGSFRTAYTGVTLREHLGLPASTRVSVRQ
jgi:FMN-dependent oxidoreductase (nitrilotriacetate monooxygenase family)